MYNRYIPQNDGSYRRSRMPDSSRPAHPSRQAPQPAREASREPICEEPVQEHHEPPKKAAPVSGNVGSFLRQLLPKDFDTGDLIVVLLLLLMAGDCQEDQNTALLTLALYLFL